MNPNTRAAIDRLEGTEWFTRCGERDLKSNAFSYSDSWKAAIESGTGEHWFNVRLEAINRFRERIFSVDKARMNQWNATVLRVREISDPLVERKLSTAVQAFDLPSSVVDEAKRDILRLLVSFEYSDIVPPGMPYALSYYYEQGHWPCGWDGPEPGPTGPIEGRLIVF